MSLIPIVSKLCESNMYDGIVVYIDKSLSPDLFGYRKNHSTEQCLTFMLEIWKKALDFRGGFRGGELVTSHHHFFPK